MATDKEHGNPAYEPLNTGHILGSEWAVGLLPHYDTPPPRCPVDGAPMGTCTHDVGYLVAEMNRQLAEQG